MAQPEFHSNVVLIHKDSNIELDRTSDLAERIICIDLDEMGADSTLQWIDRFQELTEPKEPSEDLFEGGYSVAPCLVVIGSSTDSEDGILDELVRAGAVCCSKPEGFDDSGDQDKVRLLSTMFEQQYINLDLDSAGYVLNDKTRPVEEYPLHSEGYVPVADANDSSIYDDPPFQIAELDYERLLQRMQDDDEG